MRNRSSMLVAAVAIMTLAASHPADACPQVWMPPSPSGASTKTKKSVGHKANARKAAKKAQRGR